MEIPPKRFFKFKRYLRHQDFADIEVQVRDSYTWSKTDSNEHIVQKMLHSYRLHGLEPETWPIATWADPYFVSSGILSLPVVSGGLGHGGTHHVANEYMTIEGLRDFERFVATFLYIMSNASSQVMARQIPLNFLLKTRINSASPFGEKFLKTGSLPKVYNV